MTMEDNFREVVARDKEAKKNGTIVGRYIKEQYADGYAFYEVVKVLKSSAKIRVITEIGDDWRIPYWGEEAKIDLDYVESSITHRDKFESFFK